MSIAIPTYVRKSAMVLAVFLFWFAVFGTAKLKKQTHYKNYAHCVAWEGSKSIVQHNFEGAVTLKDVKRLSKKYKISPNQVRVIIDNEQKRQDNVRRVIKSSLIRKSNRPIHEVMSNARFPLKLVPDSHMQLIENKTELSFRQKLNQNFEKFIAGTMRVYFKLTGISFSRKSCK